MSWKARRMIWTNQLVYEWNHNRSFWLATFVTWLGVTIMFLSAVFNFAEMLRQ